MAAPSSLPPGFEEIAAAAGGVFQLPTVSYECMDLSRFCRCLRGLEISIKIDGLGWVSGGTCILQNAQPLRKAVRKEYRLMTDDEPSRLSRVFLLVLRFHAAMNELKKNGKYSRHDPFTDWAKWRSLLGARLHALASRVHQEVCCHSSTHFAKRMEFMLRELDPTLYLPYWDSTLDGALPTPADSILFSLNFMGESSGGLLANGSFASWVTLEVCSVEENS